MRKIDLLRTKLGLEQYRWLRLNDRGADVVDGLYPDKTIVTFDDSIRFEQAARPTSKTLARFKPKEAESKQRDPKRPLPVSGHFDAYQLHIPRDKERIFLPVLIAGDREDGSYIKINLEAGADVRLFMVTAQTEEPIYLDIVQGENSNLHLSIIKHPGYSSWQMLSYRVDVAAHANFNIQSINLDSSAYHVGQIQLNGEGATADTMAASFVDSYEEIRLDTTIEHFAKHTTSNIYSHSVVRAEGYSFFAGRTYIDKGAVGSFGDQESRFLMLDPTAKADSYPVLLIEENELQAGHASSLGQLDEDSLYYLQSRGLTREEAQQLVTVGYLQPVIDAMVGKDESLAAKAGEFLRQTLLEKVSQ